MTRATLIGLAVAILLAFGWMKWHDAQVRQFAALETSRDSLATALRMAQERSNERDRVDSALSLEMRSLRRRADVSPRVDTLVVRVREADSAFASSLPDSLRAAFASLTAQHDSILAVVRTALRDCQVAGELGDQRLALRDTTIAEKSAQLAEALRQRDAYRKQAHPPLWNAILRDAPKLGIAFGLGYLLAH